MKQRHLGELQEEIRIWKYVLIGAFSLKSNCQPDHINFINYYSMKL
jgi:hypothetical protein